MKRNLAVILAVICAMMVIIVVASVNRADAMCMSEQGRPGIIGVDKIEKIKELEELYDNDEFEVPYTIRMANAEDYWVVELEGQDKYDDYVAFGIYDHMPNEKELTVLWANRMLDDEMYELLDEIGY